MLYAALIKLKTFLAAAFSGAALLCIYWSILVPAALLHRFFYGDFLGLRRPVGGPRLRRREKVFSPSDFEKMW